MSIVQGIVKEIEKIIRTEGSVETNSSKKVSGNITTIVDIKVLIDNKYVVFYNLDMLYFTVGDYVIVSGVNNKNALNAYSYYNVTKDTKYLKPLPSVLGCSALFLLFTFISIMCITTAGKYDKTQMIFGIIFGLISVVTIFYIFGIQADKKRILTINKELKKNIEKIRN